MAWGLCVIILVNRHMRGLENYASKVLLRSCVNRHMRGLEKKTVRVLGIIVQFTATKQKKSANRFAYPIYKILLVFVVFLF